MADNHDKKITEVNTDVPAVKLKNTTPGKHTRQQVTAETLKDRFKAGSIPLQSDYANLIDMANLGAQAIGLASGQTGPGKGMKISESGQLEPDVLSYGFDNAGCSNIMLDSKTNKLVVDLGKGLIDNGSGVSIDPKTVLPTGIITMFHGTKAPEGWALCDGTNGTPDLRDRFIVGKGSQFTQEGNGSTETEKTTVQGQVDIKETALTLDQIPEHRHQYTRTYSNRRKFDGEQWYSGYVSSTSEESTSSAGGGQGHKHGATLSMQEHTHKFNAIPPYYALAFIMKL
ncbi:hypothetical protein ACGVWS_01710 [Enterobacteriaceae bacterium LUAb1]